MDSFISSIHQAILTMKAGTGQGDNIASYNPYHTQCMPGTQTKAVRVKTEQQ